MDWIETLHALDEKVLLFFNSWNNSFFDDFMVSATHKFTWIPFYVSLLVFLVYRQGWRKSLVWVVAIALTVALADMITSQLIRPLVGRWRPTAEENPISEIVHMAGGFRRGGFGFPSCHASNSMALATIIFLSVRSLEIRVLMVSWAILHSYTRLYLAVHYPGDLLAGALIGILVGAVVYLGVRKLQQNWKFLQKGNPELDPSNAETQSDGTMVIGGKFKFNMSLLPISVFLITLLVASF